jgi:hypothetical protein
MLPPSTQLQLLMDLQPMHLLAFHLAARSMELGSSQQHHIAPVGAPNARIS